MDTIGATIRRLRRWRGMTLEQAAGLAGMSKGYLSKIENGRAPVDRRSTVVALANALRVSVADITGDGLELRDPDADQTIPAIRSALLDHDLDDAPPVGELSALVAEAHLLAGLRQANQPAEVGRRLPDVLVGLHSHAAEPEGLRGLVTAAHTTALLVKELGNADLSWIAADRGHDAAERLGEAEWVALAEFARTQALSALGAHARASKLAARGLELVPADVVDVRGALTLTAGHTAAVLGDDPAPALDEAAGLAEHVEDGNARNLLFTPANVVLWRMSAALEVGDHAAAAALADTIHPAELTIDSRRTTYWIERARALHGLRRPDDDVIRCLLTAEKIGAVRTRSNPFAREIVSALLERGRSRTVTREARGLADRMGLVRAG